MHASADHYKKKHEKDNPENKVIHRAAGEAEQKGLQEDLYFSELAFFITFDFCDHTNVLHIQKEKSVRMGKGRSLKLKENESNCISSVYHSHIERERKYQVTHKHYFWKIFKAF